jgi:hypothetical protein
MPWFERATDTIRSSPRGDDGGSAGDGEAWDLLSELASFKPEIRRHAVAKIQEHNRTDLAPRLLNLLKSVSPEVRRDAAEVLGFVGYEIPEEAGQGLIGLLYDPESEVREESVVALWRLALAAAVPELQKVMCFDTDAGVRRSVARMLSAFADVSHASFFEYALRDPDVVVRANAAVGIGLGGNIELRERLERLVELEGSEMARAGYFCGLWLLGGGPQMLEAFVRLGKDPEIFAETCQWIHRFLDQKPSSADALRDLGRVRTALRNYPEAQDVVRRIALWQGELMLEKAKAASAGEAATSE